MIDDDARKVLGFWLEECEPQDWYAGGDALDAAIRERFGPLWKAARDGELSTWGCHPEGALAFLILTDQFPRNMFRGTPEAFSTDPLALDAAKKSLLFGHDRRIDGPARQFFYLPLEHSESIMDQDRAVRLIASRMDAPETLLHARAHRKVIRDFGRFPNRNAALGRPDRGCEARFLADGGYGHVVREMQAAS
jgi:uncharacterized protein (DUF924 family)